MALPAYSTKNQISELLSCWFFQQQNLKVCPYLSRQPYLHDVWVLERDTLACIYCVLFQPTTIPALLNVWVLTQESIFIWAMHRSSLWNKTPNNSLLTSKPWQELWSSQDTRRAGSWDYQADKEASWPHLPYKQERSDHSPLAYDTDTDSPRGNYWVTWTGMTQPLRRRVKRAVHATLCFCRPRRAKPDWWCGFLVTVHRKYLWPCPFLKRWTQPSVLLREKSTPQGPGSDKPAAGKSPRGEKRQWLLLQGWYLPGTFHDRIRTTKTSLPHPLPLPTFSIAVPPILHSSSLQWGGSHPN